MNADPADFSPPLLRIQEKPAPPLAGWMLRMLVALVADVELRKQELDADGKRYALQPGMQVASEIHLGTRTVLEYLLSPVQKAFHDAARER